MNPIGTSDKESIFKLTEEYLQNNNMHIVARDTKRPWGGFFVLDENEAEKFITCFFPEFTVAQLAVQGREGTPPGKLSPKILIVAPHTRLSWQYHYRRAEIWTLISGEASVIRSETDRENETIFLKKGNSLELKQGERHRLVGLGNWGIIAEIWRHTDPDHPSDEEDIVRLQDDFGR